MKKVVFIILYFILFSLLGCNGGQAVNLKIISYNIRHGEGMDTILDLSRSERIIVSHSPDICGLQEVDSFCKRSDSVNQTNYLAQKTLMTGTFGRFMDYQGGQYGMATLTAKPVISTKILLLPDGKYEPRTSIVQEIQVTEGCTIVFANVHFDWVGGKQGSTSRLNQARALVTYIDTLDRATIITGDFNCTPGSPTMQYFTEQGFVFAQKGEDNLSFQGNPKVEIDHLIYRNKGDMKFEKISIQLIADTVASDHRPLVAELTIHF